MQWTIRSKTAVVWFKIIAFQPRLSRIRFSHPVRILIPTPLQNGAKWPGLRAKWPGLRAKWPGFCAKWPDCTVKLSIFLNPVSILSRIQHPASRIPHDASRIPNPESRKTYFGLCQCTPSLILSRFSCILQITLWSIIRRAFSPRNTPV